MSQALRNVKRSCLSKNGGNKPVVYLIIPDEVQATAMADQLAVGHTVRPAPVLNSGAEIYSMEADRRTLRFSESERQGPEGESYDLSLTWKASPMTPELIDARRRMRRRRVHVLWTDKATGKTRYMELAKPSYSGDSSNTRGNRNEATWTMRAASKYPAPFIDTVLADGEVTSNGAIILIHTPSGQRFSLTTDADGSLITTPISSTGGTPSIPLDNGYELVLEHEDGTLATIP